MLACKAPYLSNISANLTWLASSQTEPGYCKVVFGKPLQAALKPSINKQKAKKAQQHGKKTTASPAELLQPVLIPAEGEDPVAMAKFKSAIEASFQGPRSQGTRGAASCASLSWRQMPRHSRQGGPGS